jgi:hypothetical protein
LALDGNAIPLDYAAFTRFVARLDEFVARVSSAGPRRLDHYATHLGLLSASCDRDGFNLGSPRKDSERRA